jgi:RNA polymerase sigma-70 factor (ECF subfamily)
MQDAAPDSGLLDRIRAGDKSACAECIEHYGAGIYRLARQLTDDDADAEDVVQETFLQAFKAIDSFEGRSGLGTWLYRIAYNTALMRHRAHRPAVSLEENLQEEDGATVPEQLYDWCCLPEQDLQTAEVRTELAQAIAELPETLRTVFVLREQEGLLTEACAETLQLSVDVVKQRLHRARLRLRERLSEYFAERIQD